MESGHKLKYKNWKKHQMKNPDTRKPPYVVLKVAIWGGMIFAALTAFGMVFSQFIYLLAGIPKTQLEIFLTGKMSVYGSVYLHIFLCMVVNGLIGALICAALAAFMQSFKEGKHEK